MTARTSQHQLGLAHFSAIDVPPVDFARLGAKAGFSSIGLRLHPAFPGAPFYELPLGSEAAREMKRCLEGEGVAVYDIEFVVISPDFEPAGLAPVLEAAADLGARRLSVCGDDPDRSRLVARFAALCDLAAGFGLGVDLENMGWRTVATFADALSVLRQADRGNAGALVDALHFFRNGGRADEIGACPATRIRSVQLCDVRGPAPADPDAMVREARSGRVAPGHGDLPLAEFVNAVPDGAVFSVEVPLGSGADPRSHVRTLFEAGWRILERGRRV